MKRTLTLAMLVVASTIALPLPVAAAGSATCDYWAADKSVRVVLTGDTSTYLHRFANGRIAMSEVWCDSAATVTNTDTIIVTGDGESQSIIVQLGEGGFKPGATGEPGSSDEIEFSINLSGGTFDTVWIVGTAGVNKIDLGQNNTQLGLVRKINLNAGESTGTDSDVAMFGVDRVTILAKGGNDVIRARGKAGTGPDPFGAPLRVYGDFGDDTIKGGEGPDELYGDQGKDEVWGFGSADVIGLDDGVGGDVGYGGAGADTGNYDTGDDWTQ